MKYGEKPLSWATGGPDDEGWSAEGWTVSHEGDHVRLEWWSDGSDCEGRLSRGGVSVWDGETYRKGHDGTFVPAWQAEGSHQRDYTAEAAGY